MYFESTDNPGGMICETESNTDKKVFRKIKHIQQKSFEDVNGTFMEQEDGTICAIRLSPTAFFEVVLGLQLVLVLRLEDWVFRWLKVRCLRGQ